MVIVEYDENHIDKIVWNFNGFILKITKSALLEKKEKILENIGILNDIRRMN